MRLLIDDVKHGPDCTQLEFGDRLYVHLCDGKVIEVAPATAVRVTDHSVEALDNGTIVAVFRRSDVYLAADIAMEPPSLE